MPITTTDFAQLTEELQTIYNEAARTKIAESTGFQLFNAFDTELLNYEHQILHGTEGHKLLTEGEDIPKTVSEEGDNVLWTQAGYGMAISITKKMRMFDLYNQIRQLPKTMIDDAFDKIDQSMADRILGGWSGTYLDPFGQTVTATGPDGVVLFHSTHTNNLNSNSFSNLITDSSSTTNPALSRDAIVFTRAAAMVHKDPLKLTRPVNLDTLIVSPKNTDQAMRIIGSDGMSGTANNDINPLRGRVKLVTWARLDSNSAGTDTSNYWFLADSSKISETLNIVFAERPSLDAPDIVYMNKNWDYTSDFYYTLGTGYMPYLRGSTGAGS